MVKYNIRWIKNNELEHNRSQDDCFGVSLEERDLKKLDIQQFIDYIDDKENVRLKPRELSELGIGNLVKIAYGSGTIKYNKTPYIVNNIYLYPAEKRPNNHISFMLKPISNRADCHRVIYDGRSIKSFRFKDKDYEDVHSKVSKVIEESGFAPFSSTSMESSSKKLDGVKIVKDKHLKYYFNLSETQKSEYTIYSL